MPRGGPGPQSPEAKAKARRNARRLQVYRVKHGCWHLQRTGTLRCDLCFLKAECPDFQDGGTCRVIKRIETETLAWLRNVPGLGPADERTMESYARQRGVTWLWESWLARNWGASRKYFLVAQGHLLKLARQLGLTPRGKIEREKALKEATDGRTTETLADQAATRGTESGNSNTRKAASGGD